MAERYWIVQDADDLDAGWRTEVEESIRATSPESAAEVAAEQAHDDWWWESGESSAVFLVTSPDGEQSRVTVDLEYLPSFHARPAEVNTCRASRDGECSWRFCPQLRDGEPKRSGRHCPLDEGCPRCGRPEEQCAC